MAMTQVLISWNLLLTFCMEQTCRNLFPMQLLLLLLSNVKITKKKKKKKKKT